MPSLRLRLWGSNPKRQKLTLQPVPCEENRLAPSASSSFLLQFDILNAARGSDFVQTNSTGMSEGQTEATPYPAVDGGSRLHQELDAGLQLLALVLETFLLLLRHPWVPLLPQQGVVGQDGTVQGGMAWKTGREGGDDSPSEGNDVKRGCKGSQGQRM